jgi:hypothetical protein
MATDTAGTSVHASVLVAAPIAHAFMVFTEQMGTWWPHRNLDRHGDGWEPMRDSVAGSEGWPKELAAFAKAAAA